MLVIFCFVCDVKQTNKKGIRGYSTICTHGCGPGCISTIRSTYSSNVAHMPQVYNARETPVRGDSPTMYPQVPVWTPMRDNVDELPLAQSYPNISHTHPIFLQRWEGSNTSCKIDDVRDHNRHQTYPIRHQNCSRTKNIGWISS